MKCCKDQFKAIVADLINVLTWSQFEIKVCMLENCIQLVIRQRVPWDPKYHLEHFIQSLTFFFFSQEASHQIENLLEQISSETNEKEQVLLELAASQEQCQQYSTSLGNLQMVLEQFQQGITSNTFIPIHEKWESALSRSICRIHLHCL